MKSKPIRSLSSADRDFDAIIEHYISTASFDVATRFVHALDAAYALLSEASEAGPPRLGHALDLHGLRAWKLRDFPYLICYAPTADAVVVWRIIHMQRDLAAALAEAGSQN